MTAPQLPAWMQNIEDRLKPFQKQVRHFAMTRPACAMWMTMGSGKTLVTLSALSYLREPGHILVVAPRNIAVDTWPSEVFDWDVPLRVTSLNITPPGMLDKKGRPLKGQRNLKPEEFRRLIDSVSTDPAGMYTIGVDRFTELVDRIVYAGDPRTRPPGQPRGDGQFDLDSFRDAEDAIIEAFDTAIAGHKDQKSIKSAFRDVRMTTLRPGTASGLAPTLVFSHPNPKKAALLRQDDLREALAGAVATATGARVRVAVTVAKPNFAAWPFSTLIIDEAQGFKNPSSNRWKAMAKVRPYVRRVIELSGTPSPEGAHEIWPQIYLLDQGATLGTSYTQHLESWFTPDQIVNDKVTKWKISSSNEEQLHKTISHLAISAENTELKLMGYADPVTHVVPMSDDLREAYKAFARDALLSVLLTGLEQLKAEAYRKELERTADRGAIIAAEAAAKAAAATQRLDDDDTAKEIEAAVAKVVSTTGDRTKAREAADAVTLDDATAHQIEAANGGVLRGKLMQFAAGAVYVDIDKDSPDYAKATEFTRRPILRLHSAKIDKVLEIVDNHFASGEEGSILVAYRFDFEKSLLLNRLHEAGYDKAREYNGMPDTKKAWNRGDIPVMLVHPASAGHGLNLQWGGHVLIWLTLPDPNEQFGQTPARLNRLGQTQPVVVHTILTEGTIDMSMPAALESKQASQQRLMQATRAELKGALASIIADQND